jgi:hypothetical protein
MMSMSEEMSWIFRCCNSAGDSGAISDSVCMETGEVGGTGADELASETDETMMELWELRELPLCAGGAAIFSPG